ncbi:MAG: imidazole glycerol phosphate synthase subunit HisH [Lachnospiraceae bacterium]|nr:imidazole glycerol phosphate synthase subunit HisH [Lachnospiraceae bacterium]
MITVIDYDAGNIMSVIKAFEYLGEKVLLTADENEILNADRIILPGVGNFGDCMAELNKRDLSPVIKKAVASGIPFMGICLGLQLMFDDSEEAQGVEGLRLLEGHVKRLPKKDDLKIPNIGWNSLDLPRESRLFEGIEDGSFVYFVHSYYLAARDEDIVCATIDYGTRVHAAVEKDNIFGCQFHPEKSSETGLNIIRNFLKVK